uniref:RdRp n=1 Tax=viral metagenome TaxID=1070528 RepID=A0A2V0RAS0_9ZZZZ
MFSGLHLLDRLPTRLVKDEFTTHTDPFVLEALSYFSSPGDLSILENWSKSYYTLDAHMQSIYKYNKTLVSEPSTTEWSTVLTESFEYFRTLPKVTVMSAKTDFDNVRYRQSTSAGYGYTSNFPPYPSHKGVPHGPNHTRAKRISSSIVRRCLSEHNSGNFQQFLSTLAQDSTPDVAFTRTQLAELPSTKVRNVFGECFHYVILEGLIAQPLIDAFMQLDSFYYIGEDPLIGIPQLINNLSDDEKCSYVTLDWSTFDSSVQPYEIELAFDLIRSMITFPDLETRLVFDYVRTLFLSRKILAPDGQLFLRYGGIPSGSYFTHMVDSIINWIRIKYLFKRINVTPTFLKTHGDDSLIVIETMFHSLQPLVEEANLNHWPLKPEKIALVRDKSEIEFLGRSISNLVNYRDPIKCFRLMVYTEYPVEDPQISIARVKAIFTDSGLTLPYATEIYNFLKIKYEDRNLPLPAQFQQFRHTETHNDTLPVSI